MIDAAAQLFAERGYARTTLAAIADQAGVSIETVQAQGPKRQLLEAALLRVTIGRDGYEPILETPEAAGLVEAATPAEFARAAAELMSHNNAQMAGIWRAFSSAAADDPAVDQEWSSAMAGIRSDVAAVVALVAARGWTRTDVDSEELVASAWILVGVETFEKLTVRLGWSTDRYRSWLARSLQVLLFDRETASSARPGPSRV